MGILDFLKRLFGQQAETVSIGELLLSSASDDPGIGGGAEPKISHALVLPDQNFLEWYKAAEAYTQAFERVVVVRSPAGNDLNRYRNITAIEAPNVWLDNNALYHIRRIYPSVVRVDTIKAKQPSQLKTILQQRISASDRYGEKNNSDNHLDDRFVVSWPSDALPASIVIPFDAAVDGKPNEGIDLYAPLGTTLRAAISGTVAVVNTTPTALGYGQYVQISTVHNGTTYLVTQTHFKKITVRSGQSINAGDELGTSEGENSRLVVQAPGKGLSGYALPHVIDPTPLIYWNTLRLHATDNGLRVRKRPGLTFEIVAQVNVDDALETLEPHGRTLAKVGRDEQWINVRTPNGRTGYTAAWFLNAVSPELLDRTRLTGINLDYAHRLGKPAPNRLGNMGWVRFTYNVSYNPSNNSYGNTDLTAAYNRLNPFIEQYAHAGYKVILVLTHQTFGEGAGFNWQQMDNSRWHTLITRFVDMVRVIARQYAGRNVVHAYQIWNEQDAPEGAAASVTMPAGNYAFMLGETIRAIREADTQVKVITGGHTGGPTNGANYAAATLRAMPPGILPDGIAFHPYGRGVQQDAPYSFFGHIDESITRYGAVMRGKPLWITEWGVLDQSSDPARQVSTYARNMVNYIRLNHPGRVAAMVWFAWAMGMHNGYGLVDNNDKPIQPLYDDFIQL